MTRKKIKEKKGKIASREMSNGAFILLLIVCVIIAGVIGWFLGTWVANI